MTNRQMMSLPNKRAPEGAFLNFAKFTVDFAEFFIEAILGFIEREIIGAGIIFFEATKGFFILGEAIPRVVFIFGGGDAPEVIIFLTVCFGVENHLD